MDENGIEFTCEPEKLYENCCMKGVNETHKINLRYDALPCGYLCSGTPEEFVKYCSAIINYEEEGVWNEPEYQEEECRDCERGDWQNIYIWIKEKDQEKTLSLEDYSLQVQSLVDGTWVDYKSYCSNDTNNIYSTQRKFNCASTYGASPMTIKIEHKDGRTAESVIDTKVNRECLGKSIVYFTVEVPKASSEQIIINLPEYLSSCDLL